MSAKNTKYQGIGWKAADFPQGRWHVEAIGSDTGRSAGGVSVDLCEAPVAYRDECRVFWDNQLIRCMSWPHIRFKMTSCYLKSRTRVALAMKSEPLSKIINGYLV